jgi:hypothetical protein
MILMSPIAAMRIQKVIHTSELDIKMTPDWSPRKCSLAINLSKWRKLKYSQSISKSKLNGKLDFMLFNAESWTECESRSFSSLFHKCRPSSRNCQIFIDPPITRWDDLNGANDCPRVCRSAQRMSVRPFATSANRNPGRRKSQRLQELYQSTRKSSSGGSAKVQDAGTNMDSFMDPQKHSANQQSRGTGRRTRSQNRTAHSSPRWTGNDEEQGKSAAVPRLHCTTVGDGPIVKLISPLKVFFKLRW